jgi:4'-phosphopantetheinyl transferase
MSDGVLPLRLRTEKTIEVWRIDLDRPLNPGVSLDEILSTEERERAGRYAFAKDAYRFRLCRAMLRQGLAGYLRKTPREITFAANCYGKPFLAEHQALHFNVTHSGGLGLIAFSTAGEVGIDVEAIERGVEFVDIAAAYFTEKESAMVAAAQTPQEQARIFLRLWTRKEAVLKAAGFGLQGGLGTVDVSQPSVNLVKLAIAPDKDSEIYWRVMDLEMVDGFFGAVATPAGNWSVVQRTVDYEDTIG